MTVNDTPTPEPKPLSLALRRGFLGRCPKCGEGRMFRAFLKVADACPACGEPLHHHRADDLPAYLVIAVVGHVVVGLMLWLEQAYQPSTLVHVALWVPLALIMCLALLQTTKGAVVALQWHAGMHGFPGANPRPAQTPPHTVHSAHAQ
jgi:uncharacterized protein (DUF983 family)